MVLRKASTKGTFDPHSKAVEALHMSVAGLKQGSTYCGIENHFLAAMRWQHFGCKLVAVARPSEVSQLSMAVLGHVC